MKTNEELAMMIQDGDKARIPELWERVRGLYMKKAFVYFHNHAALCARCGVDLDDVKQQSFFAFLHSIEQYEPECELAFTSYINYPFQTEMQELTRTRHSGQLQDCLNRCSSLDAPIETDEGTDSTVGDFVPDPTALEFLELLDAQSVGEMVRAEVQKLPEPVCTVIQLFFFAGQTLGTIADALGISPQRAQQQKQRGLVMLSKRRVLVDLWNETHHTQKLRKLEAAANASRPDMSFIARSIYERVNGNLSKLNVVERAELHAEELREAAEASGEEWTREKKIAAIMEYLTQPQTVHG